MQRNLVVLISGEHIPHVGLYEFFLLIFGHFIPRCERNFSEVQQLVPYPLLRFTEVLV